MTRELLFVHINKTGGSSIEHALGIKFQHKTASELKAEVGEERWRNGLSFSFVRNPWDRVVSHYFWRLKTNQTNLQTKPIAFADWVERAYGDMDPRYYDKPKMFMPQSRWLVDESPHSQRMFLVEFVGRFENLQSDFETLCRDAGFRSVPMLPHLKTSNRNEPVSSLYTPSTVRIVARHFAEDIENFGYRWQAL